MSGIAAPAVIDNDLVFYGRIIKQPRKQLRTMPLGRCHLPLAVAEDDRGLVVSDQVFKLREHVLLDIARFVVKPERVVPLIQRIVIAHAHTFAADSFG
jgi:hypothetical protein